jgi:hypothetical protein
LRITAAALSISATAGVTASTLMTLTKSDLGFVRRVLKVHWRKMGSIVGCHQREGGNNDPHWTWYDDHSQ